LGFAEKEISTKEFVLEATKIKEVTDAYEVPLIINDRVDGKNNTSRTFSQH
jgi:thiamine monophosphate synthase